MSEHLRPHSRKAFVVFGKEATSQAVWRLWEWPALMANPDIHEVHTYEVQEDGDLKSVGEIKASGVGSPF
jgi:hypothetical protein